VDQQLFFFGWFFIVGIDLIRISEFRDQYYLDEEVHQAKTSHMRGDKKTMAVEEFLNPPYRKKYGLDMNDYLDHEGYFAPNGMHWKTWSLKTQTAAFLMLSSTTRNRVTEIRNALICITGYYEENNKSMALIHIIEACNNK
jgi:hypothetical protein